LNMWDPINVVVNVVARVLSHMSTDAIYTGIGFRIAHPGGPRVLPHRRGHQEQGPAKSPSHNRHLRGGSLLARSLIERKEARRV
jgi:hypothetical protein